MDNYINMHIITKQHTPILMYKTAHIITTKQFAYLVLQSNFQKICGHKIPFTGTWVDSRLKELSIESKNTKFGVLTKELCKLQAMKKISSIAALAAADVAIQSWRLYMNNDLRSSVEPTQFHA